MALLLCSRNETVRKKWYTALSSRWKIHQAASHDELLSVWQRFQVDTLLVHRSLVDEAQLRELCAMKADSRIFVFSDRPDNAEGAACLQLGCVGYANTYIAPARLVAAIEAVESGLVWVGNSLMSYLIEQLPGTADDIPEEPDQLGTVFDSLSKREYQIAKLVADGLNNNEIAQELEITERTVKAHLSSIFMKTKTKGRLNLALLMKKG